MGPLRGTRGLGCQPGEPAAARASYTRHLTLRLADLLYFNCNNNHTRLPGCRPTRSRPPTRPRTTPHDASLTRVPPARRLLTPAVRLGANRSLAVAGVAHPRQLHRRGQLPRDRAREGAREAVRRVAEPRARRPSRRVVLGAA